ncbi:MAG: hypothetical protein NWE94_08615 [Candidatus Bathyarchaeota archaeon]|nr:hypothetical protein [Candidatus Bathyarchaeota archaeon]
METASRFTCPNASCGRIFDRPLKAVNLQLNSEKFYYACPYCLTEIVVEAEKPATASSEKSLSCTHHVGYLSERSSGESIPEECILCKNLTACMLKNMRR